METDSPRGLRPGGVPLDDMWHRGQSFHSPPSYTLSTSSSLRPDPPLPDPDLPFPGPEVFSSSLGDSLEDMSMRSGEMSLEESAASLGTRTKYHQSKRLRPEVGGGAAVGGGGRGEGGGGQRTSPPPPPDILDGLCNAGSRALPS